MNSAPPLERRDLTTGPTITPLWVRPGSGGAAPSGATSAREDAARAGAAPSDAAPSGAGRTEAARTGVLLLHGACADHRSVAPLLDAFDADATILLPDLRGQGAHRLAPTTTADFTGIVDDLEVILDQTSHQGDTDARPHPWPTHWTVVGHSFGSHVAQELAARRPDLVHRLVLIGSYDQHAEPGRGERARVALTTAIVRAIPWRWFARFSARVATVDASLRPVLLDTHLAAGRTVFLELGRSGSRAKRAVDHYEMPVLVLRGAREYSRRLGEIHEAIARRSPHGRTAEIADAGHLCHEERPEEVRRLIREFLADQHEGTIPA